MSDRTSFAAHLSAYLGPAAGCWPVDPSGRRMPFQIRAYNGGPVRRVSTFATVGLWKKPLEGEKPDVRVREEVILMVRETPDAELLPGVLLQVVGEVLKSRRALLPGDVVGPRGPLLPDAEAQALFVAAPSYLPDGFHMWRSPKGERVGVLWLVPITKDEAAFVRKHGPAAFEEVLVAEQPDLLNVMRTSVPLPMIVLSSRAYDAEPPSLAEEPYVEASATVPSIRTRTIDESEDEPPPLVTRPAPLDPLPAAGTPAPLPDVAPSFGPPELDEPAETSGAVDDMTAESTFDGGVGNVRSRLEALAAAGRGDPPPVDPAADAGSEPLAPPMMLDEGWDAASLGALAQADAPVPPRSDD